ncbi:MAG: hypothetical protein ABSD74_14770 [Rhizomicrobium sp.]|jgi:hypothetical protein
MSISGVAASAASYTSSWPSQQSTLQQNFTQLTQAIQSGNLSSAQQAYATLMQSMPASANGPTAGQSGNPFQTAIAQIGAALQNGSMSAAQSALSGMQTQMRSAPHHHHHRGGGMSAGSSTASSSSSSPSTTSTILSTSALAGIVPGSSTNILA